MKVYQNQEVYFAFLDILGFKNLVLNNENEYLSEIYSEIIDKCVLEGITLGRSRYQEDGYQSAIINSLTVSDSIMLWTNHDNIWGLLEISEATRYILSKTMEHGIPLRGIITKGPVVYQSKIADGDRNFDNGRITLAGKALVKAYTEEGKYNWAGCIIDEELIQIWESSVIRYYLKDAKANKIYVNYLVPVKAKDENGRMEIQRVSKTVFNWVNDCGPDFSEEDVRNAFSAHSKGTEQVKIDNTLEFYRAMKRSQ